MAQRPAPTADHVSSMPSPVRARSARSRSAANHQGEAMVLRIGARLGVREGGFAMVWEWAA
ncbi:hypothetical protein ACGFZP_23270 [Kitasatospora sp. NPDC048239]|uniref:hypothetical protein n=1 Tax=Kitasatospora sp. NPDC048239 TaxID=3364046 RepID=UPI003711D2BB